MISLWRILRVSRVLDDRDRRTGRAEAQFGDQGRIDAELSDARAVPWERPSPRMRSCVLREIEMRRLSRPRRVESHGWPMRFALAAAFALACVAPAWNIVKPHLTQVREAAPIAVNDDSDGDPFILSGIAARSVPMLSENLDAPLRQAAIAIGEDTRRAAQMILSRLPIGD